jgi:15-cis-phytoene desaturase
VPLTTGLYFLPPERYSAYAFFGTLGPYLPQIYTVRVGAFRGGMTEVLCAPLAAAIQRSGGIVHTNAPVSRLLVDGGRVVGVVAAGRQIPGSHVVLATSLAPAQNVICASLAEHPWFQNMLRLPSMPAITVQVELDGPSMAVDHTTFGPGTALASFAEQSRTTFRGMPGRISIILASPDRFVDSTDAEIMDVVYRDSE